MTNIIITLLLIISFSDHSNDLGYKKNEDPTSQITKASDVAKKEKKLILLIAGGDWCRWCHVLNQYLSNNKSIYDNINETFVVAKIYVGEANMNEEFFSRLPKATGYPHFWVVSSGLKVLDSQNTGVLEKGREGYDNEKFNAFVSHWKKYNKEH